MTSVIYRSCKQKKARTIRRLTQGLGIRSLLKDRDNAGTKKTVAHPPSYQATLKSLTKQKCSFLGAGTNRRFPWALDVTSLLKDRDDTWSIPKSKEIKGLTMCLLTRLTPCNEQQLIWCFCCILWHCIKIYFQVCWWKVLKVWKYEPKTIINQIYKISKSI